MAEANKTYKYLVVSLYGDDDTSVEDAQVMTAAEIFNIMDMEDCFPCELMMDIYRINGLGLAPSECSFLGKGHDPKDRQKMAIVGDGICETGYGTEH